jgi:demethylmenaquinone methyltransferase/2-methoxy-6-polyprenyl-1,4-benzoquinol methylase
MKISTTNSSKSASVNRLFGNIAGRYDLANHVLSLGIDRRWRKRAASLTVDRADCKVLDMCCGTGDFAISFARGKTPPKQITACDFSEEMVQGGRVKCQKLELGTDIEFMVQDCTATDLNEGSFDVISCAFGVRNMDDLNKGLSEMHRLLTDGGKVCILEFSLPKIKPIRWLYLAYFVCVLPIIGGLISGNFGAYRYLVSSVLDWDKNVDLPKRLADAGFEMVTVEPVSFGIAGIYIAKKK